LLMQLLAQALSAALLVGLCHAGAKGAVTVGRAALSALGHDLACIGLPTCANVASAAASIAVAAATAAGRRSALMVTGCAELLAVGTPLRMPFSLDE
jgi:hypothetical protein